MSKRINISCVYLIKLFQKSNNSFHLPEKFFFLFITEVKVGKFLKFFQNFRSHMDHVRGRRGVKEERRE